MLRTLRRASRSWSGRRAITICGRPTTLAARAARRRALRAAGRALPQLRRAHAGRSVRALARRRARRARSCRRSCCSTTRSARDGAARATPSRGRRSPACARPTKTCSRPIRMRRVTTWCAARVDATEARLAALPADVTPDRRESLPAAARSSPCCRAFRASRSGAARRRTEDWHRRFNVEAVVYGHLHLRSITRARRRALRGSVAGLSEAVGSEQAARALPAKNYLTGLAMAPYGPRL